MTLKSLIKHGGGSVLAWTCMAVSGTGSLVLIDVIPYDGSIMNLEVDQNIANLERNSFYWWIYCTQPSLFCSICAISTSNISIFWDIFC